MEPQRKLFCKEWDTWRRYVEIKAQPRHTSSHSLDSMAFQALARPTLASGPQFHEPHLYLYKWILSLAKTTYSGSDDCHQRHQLRPTALTTEKPQVTESRHAACQRAIYPGAAGLGIDVRATNLTSKTGRGEGKRELHCLLREPEYSRPGRRQGPWWLSLTRNGKGRLPQTCSPF